MLGPVVAALLAAVPAPTDVTVSWDNGAAVVTWQETGDQRNRVDLVNADGSPTSWASKIVEAGQPNRSPLPGTIPGGTARVVVRAIDADGKPLSDPGTSPVFDMDSPADPVLDAVEPREDGTIVLRWHAGTYTDTTPGDPLDQPAPDPLLFQVWSSVTTTENAGEPLHQPGPATTFTVPKRPTPAILYVRTGNEWGFGFARVMVWSTELKATVPATATTGKPLTVTGTSTRLQRACDPGICFFEPNPDPNRPLQLQARTDPAAPWRTVASTRTGKDSRFAFTVNSPGNRQYRVVAPPVNLSANQQPAAYAASAVFTVTSKPAPAPGGGDEGGEGGGLPVTGPPVAWLIALATALVAAGAGLRRLAR